MRGFSLCSTIIYMSEMICVTNRKLCGDDFLARIERIAQCRPSRIILREKDLSEAEYTRLAEKVMRICGEYDVPCVLHSFIGAAIELGAEEIHLPLHIFTGISERDKSRFGRIGVSCHSAEEAIQAKRLGAGYIIAGHVFETDCKQGLPGRGLKFLSDVCKSVSIPVYAIGGIGSENVGEVISAGADGVCIMSGFMVCDDVKEYMDKLRGGLV